MAFGTLLDEAARVDSTGTRTSTPVRRRATGLSLSSWVLFASSGPLAASVMAAGWSPAAVTAVRIAAAAALLGLVVAVRRPSALRFGRGDTRLLVGYGLFGVAGVQLLFFVAVARVPVGVAMVLVNLAPALVALWIRVVRGTRLPPAVWVGIGAALVGLVATAQLWDGVRADPVGIAAGLGSAACSAGFFLFGAHGAARYDPFGMTVVGLAIGAVSTFAVAPPWTLPFGLLAESVVLRDIAVPLWSALLVLAVAGTAVPYLVGLRALRDLPAPLAGALSMVEPLVATGLAWVLLGQSLRPVQFLGMVTVLLGAVAVHRAMP